MDDYPKSDIVEIKHQVDLGELLNDLEITSAIQVQLNSIYSIRDWFNTTQNYILNFELIETELMSGSITKKDLNDIYYKITWNTKGFIKLLELNLSMSFIYTCIAKNLESQHRLIQAWKALSKANNHLGKSAQIHHNLTNPLQTRAKSGGEAKARNSNKLVKLIITTLIKDRPPKGWKSVSTALEKVMWHYDNPSDHSVLLGNREQILERATNLLHEDNLIKLVFASD